MEEKFINENSNSKIDRRNFLKLSGFSLAGAAALAGCKNLKVEKAIPYLVKPEEITPGVSNWYSTTCAGCSANCGVIVKSRDGRPIKIEGIKNHPVSNGGVCAVGQAQVLGLYDSRRLKNPIQNGDETNWETIDKKIIEQLKNFKNVYFLSNTITSPSLRNSIKNFLSRFPNSKLIEYDSMSQSAILDATEKNFGKRILPRYKFEKAELIVSIDADFLATWVSPMEFTSGYTEMRSLEKNKNSFSEHIQVESRLSLTGSNADKRYSVAQSEYDKILESLLQKIKNGKSSEILFVNKIAEKLISKKGKSLVICGVNNLRLQLLVNAINFELNNFGETIDLENYSKQLNGNDSEVEKLISEIKNKKVDAIFINSNPVYDFKNGEEFAKLLKNIPLVVSFSTHNDETSSNSNFIAPQNHWLESWSDSNSVSDVVSIMQPLILPLENTRTVLESVNIWSGKNSSSYDLVKNYWKEIIYPQVEEKLAFEKFWDKTIKTGFAKIKTGKNQTSKFKTVEIPKTEKNRNTNELDLVLYEKISMRSGQNAHNAWLQELDDPITKISWDNYISVSNKYAEKFEISEGDILVVENEKIKIELPAHLQIGQFENSVAIAVGYGRVGTDRFSDIGPKWYQSKQTVNKGETIGKNVYPLLGSDFVKISKTGKKYSLANSQEYNSLQLPKNLGYKNQERTIIQHTTFDEYKNDNKSGSVNHGKLLSMWEKTPRGSDIHWGLSIDLTKCIGCSACIISCQAENNIPVVGKDEMRRDRDLHWIRLDRYFNEYENELDVMFQPMLCQHCGNAPCETVCPVLATVHSEEGLNQQVYNRCVGTKYCANNCPYKVRRFNWFEYEHNDDKEKLVLNPDVTVRERGVIEKCSMCIQRIQETKILAKKEGRKILDGEIETACMQSCPSKAIVFGNLLDEKTIIANTTKDERAYHVLEEIGIKPSVTYLTRVKNREKNNNG